MNRFRLAFAIFALTGATGCVHRQLESFADHPSAPLTSAVVHLQKNYFFARSHEYVFYSCSENGDTLQCKRLCGGNTDLVCPELVENGNSASTNIR
jgi:hypothetical protein